MTWNISSAAEHIVELGFGSEPTASSPTWTDVTSYVRFSDGIQITRGRTAEATSIEPGSAVFVLDNLDGRFDAENPSGPYFGELTDGVPVRIRAKHSATTHTIFRGWVEAWPLVDHEVDSTVIVDCLDVVGLMAQGDAPTTAFDAAAQALSERPDQWWRPTASGWSDRINGTSARHTGGLIEQDPVIDGETHSFGQIDPDGYGAVNQVMIDPDNSNRVLVSAFVRFEIPPDNGVYPVLFQVAGNDDDIAAAYRLAVGITGVRMSVECSSWYMWADFQSMDSEGATPNLADGTVHHIAVTHKRPASSGGIGTGNNDDFRIFIDGREVFSQSYATVSSTSRPDATPQAMIGGSGYYYTGLFDYERYSGVIDHLMIWNDFQGSASDIDTIVGELYNAGRRSWAGQRLDERVTALAEAMNVDGLLGTLDESGIRTGHAYRQEGALDLLRKIEDTEQGRIFVDREGMLRFASRSWPSTTTASIPQVTFSDAPGVGELGYLASDLQMSRDPRRVTNIAQVTSEYGRMQTVEDSASIAIRGRRNAIHLSGLLHASDHESLAIAQFIVKSRSTPTTRVDAITYSVPDTADGLTAALWDLGYLVAVERKGVTHKAHITGIQHSIGEHGWHIKLALDGTRATTASFFRADISTTDGPDVANF